MAEGTSKKWQVVNKETQISFKWFETEEEAEKIATWMTSYHKEEYEVKKV